MPDRLLRLKLTKRSSSSLSTTQTFALAPPGPLPRLRSSSPHIFRAVLVKNSSLLRAPLNFLLFPNNFLKDFSLSSSLTLIEIPRLSPLRNCLKSNFAKYYFFSTMQYHFYSQIHCIALYCPFDWKPW
mgnify:CR=1 FL=1